MAGGFYHTFWQVGWRVDLVFPLRIARRSASSRPMLETSRAEWEEWGERCALAKTGAQARERLTRFLGQRFQSYLQRYARRSLASQAPRRPDGDADCAHLFESWCALRQRRDGKAYKQWLAHRGEGEASDYESGASLLMRDVVREWLRRECSPRGAISLHAPLGDAAHGLSLADLLPAPPAPLGPAQEEEWQDWLRQRVPRWLEGLGETGRMAFLARAAGLPFNHPRVIAATQASRSTLHERYRQEVLRIGREVRDFFRDPGGEEGVARSLEALQALSAELGARFSLEAGPVPAFGKTGEPHAS
jgi:hypothetical protein